ncbi:MAG: hypothetical protein AAFO02_16400, partial [Bacteroidota bacterium]
YSTLVDYQDSDIEFYSIVRAHPLLVQVMTSIRHTDEAWGYYAALRVLRAHTPDNDISLSGPTKPYMWLEKPGVNPTSAAQEKI